MKLELKAYSIRSHFLLKQGVSAADIKVILDAHNNYRRDPRAGVTAKQMLVMVCYPQTGNHKYFVIRNSLSLN